MTTRRLDLPDCIRLAEFLHYHDTDKAGFPYIEHPKRVLRAAQDMGLPPYVQMAAILHDTTEDTAAHRQMLLDMGVTPPAVDLVTAMDRKLQEQAFIALGNPKPNHLKDYEVYRAWKRARDIYYYQNLMLYDYGPDLKRCDMGDNTLAWRVSYLSVPEQEHNRTKYQFAEDVLSGRITE